MDCRCGGRIHEVKAQHEDDEVVMFCEACRCRYFEGDLPNFEVPMPFMTDMLLAIEEGLKTQTRRPLHQLHPRLKCVLPGDILVCHDPVLMITVRVEVIKTRVEHVQKISEKDSKAEGYTSAVKHWPKGKHGPYSPCTWFANLWDSIYGDKPVKCWQSNPVVKVYEFCRCDEQSVS